MTARLGCLACRCLQAGHTCLRISRRGNGNHYEFGRWRVAALSHTIDRHQNIGFGKISGSAAARNFKRSDEKVFSYPFFSFEMTGQINQLARFESGLCQIIRI